MQAREVAFDCELEPFLPGILALIGGGGKTSLLFALAESMASRGERVICTTTTKMLLPERSAWLSVVIGKALTGIAIPPSGATFAALLPEREADADKVVGYPPETIDERFRRDPDLRILVEADGAARKPVKAPAPHEPVLPATTAAAIAVVGLGCIGKPLSAETAFRPERIAAIAALRPGDPITPAAVARLAAHPEGMFKGVPPGAARLLFCNQSDMPGAAAAGEELAAEISRRCPDALRGIYVGSLQTKGLRCLSYPTRWR